MNRMPKSASGSGDVSAFLGKVALTPRRTPSRGRMLLAMDATASREASWDRAATLHGEIFEEAGRSGVLDLQLCWYRGYREFQFSAWVTSADRLLQVMSGVRCAAGRTQLVKVLEHINREHTRQAVGAAVFIGDAAEEPLDVIADRAGTLGVKGCRVFMFQEGTDAGCRRAFQEVAHLTGGAYGALDGGSANHLRDWLRAVAAYAAGGRQGLERLEQSKRYRNAPRLSGQIRK